MAYARSAHNRNNFYSKISHKLIHAQNPDSSIRTPTWMAVKMMLIHLLSKKDGWNIHLTVLSKELNVEIDTVESWMRIAIKAKFVSKTIYKNSRYHTLKNGVIYDIYEDGDAPFEEQIKKIETIDSEFFYEKHIDNDIEANQESSGAGSSRAGKPPHYLLSKEINNQNSLSNAGAREEPRKEGHRLGTIPKREVKIAPDGLPAINLSAQEMDALTKQAVESGLSISEAKDMVNNVVTAYRLEYGANGACHDNPYWAIRKWMMNEKPNAKDSKVHKKQKEKPKSEGSWVCNPVKLEEVFNGF